MRRLTWADADGAHDGAPGGRAHASAATGALPVDLTVRSDLMARALAYLFAAGAILTLGLFAVLPHPEASTPGMLATVIAALAVAVAIEASAERLPEVALPWLVALASGLITAAIYFRASPAPAHAVFYLWVTCYSFYFFPRAVALAELALAGTGFAAVLALTAHPPAHRVEVLLLTVGTLAVAGVLIGALRRGVEEMVARLANVARTDALTGLLNRRGFEDAFELELERARRGGHALSVLIGDLDGFKKINDRFGHHAGDSALRRASSILERRKRRIDTVARLGGEEFALVVPDADNHAAYMLAERLRGALKEAFAHEPVPITISFGVAGFPAHGEGYEALLGSADDALYAAKELGRDRTVIYSREVAGILTPLDRPDGPRNEHLATVLALAEALDVRDATTSRHSKNAARYAEMIAREIGLAPDVVERIRLAGLLHDVGNIAVSSLLLSKPGPLSDEESIEMRRHAEIGARILANARLADIGEWVLAHHERPDGDGFPFGLANGDIPLEAQILAVADAYEAMTSERPYRPALNHDEARLELRRNAGSQFSERVVDAFLAALESRGSRSRAERQ